MTRLEELCKGAVVEGVEYGGPVTVIDVEWAGDDALELVYRDASGQVNDLIMFRHNEPQLKLVSSTDDWTFDGDGELFRLVTEAHRLKMAHLFDPYLAVHASLIEPLPHQISAVYEKMLPRQPLRFLLADDPGAGKTIMAGLLMKELHARGDLERCLVCCPGSLTEQWQDELRQKFGMRFEMVARQQIDESPSGNPYAEKDFVIARLDHMSRNESVQEMLSRTDWDLIVVDEAHKMSASYSGGEINETKRYRLGRLLSGVARHFLLMTATPHNGKDEDFQLFLKLLDLDRFEGRFRRQVHRPNVTDMMRRTVKEDLRRFDGTKLFPPREAFTVTYQLTRAEDRLYEEVTEYVRNEFNRAESLKSGRVRTVGFALTVLQRRLASSPEAIYRSLVRRRQRLEAKLAEEGAVKQAAEVRTEPELKRFAEKLGDVDEVRSEEIEDAEEHVLDLATAARTLAELQVEIQTLSRLERMAERLRESGDDRKWEELSGLMRDRPEMFDGDGNRRKIIVFTEHRDTLEYLTRRIRKLLGDPKKVVTVTGGMHREARRTTQASFLNDPSVSVLVATDAAGEGVNLQRANLMVNYDLPWNPNRIEQRFGRIHRIGQENKCYLWNLVADNTREGDVYQTLLGKLERESRALGGRVFDVLGDLFTETPLRELLVEAIRKGEGGKAPARVKRELEEILNHERLLRMVRKQGLAQEALSLERVGNIRKGMERVDARRLLPHFVSTFFLEAYKRLGGRIREHEPGRYELPLVPAKVLRRAKSLHGGGRLAESYVRVTFDKDLRSVPGKSHAIFLHPGHPLLDAVVALTVEEFGDVMSRGSILVDEEDWGEEMRALMCLEHVIHDSRKDHSGERHVAGRRLQFVEMRADGEQKDAGFAPYLDYRPLRDEEKDLVKDLSPFPGTIEGRAKKYAVATLVPDHLQEVAQRREERVTKTERAVRERLTQEISHWQSEVDRYQLRASLSPGGPGTGRSALRLNLDNARRRRNDLEERLVRRTRELRQERDLKPSPPVVVSAVLVVPIGLLARLGNGASPPALAQDTRQVKQLAMQAVMNREERLGHEPADVSSRNLGYDVESRDRETGRLRFIEVKARAAGATSVTVNRNEILTALNKPEDYLLAVVKVNGESAEEPRYIHRPFSKEPEFKATSVSYDLHKMLRDEHEADER